MNLAAAVRGKGGVRLALTFDYGQRAAKRETERARKITAHYGIPWKLIQLPWLKDITGTALVSKKPLPRLKASQLDDRRLTRRSADAVWVPNRNGVFLNVAAAFAESLGCREVVLGLNEEEGATFPDNTAAFGRAATKAFRFSTRSGVRVVSYTARMDKKEILNLGRWLEAPLHLVWPCYEGGAKPCGRCESCLRFRRASAS